MATDETPLQPQPESKPEPVDAGEPVPEPTFTPFVPPREAGIWILGPSGPVREE